MTQPPHTARDTNRLLGLQPPIERVVDQNFADRISYFVGRPGYWAQTSPGICVSIVSNPGSEMIALAKMFVVSTAYSPSWYPRANETGRKVFDLFDRSIDSDLNVWLALPSLSVKAAFLSNHKSISSFYVGLVAAYEKDILGLSPEAIGGAKNNGYHDRGDPLTFWGPVPKSTLAIVRSEPDLMPMP